MKNLFISIGIAVVALGAFSLGSILMPHDAQKLGAFNPTGGGTYYLQASINSTQNTITLTSFTEPSSGIPYTMSYLHSDIEYATINPTNANSEFISFNGITQNSNGTALLTGVVRGLGRSYPYTASSTLAHSAPGQTQFILSAPPEFYNEYVTKRGPNTITGTYTFGSTTPPVYDADPIWANFSGTVFADVNYVNSVVAGGAANASETVKGIVQLATTAQAALGTALGSTGARLALPASMATSTPGVQITNVIPITGTNEKLSQAFLDLTQAFTWSGLHVFTGGLMTTASSTFAATTTASGQFIENAPVQQFTSATTTTKWPLAFVIATSTGRATTGSTLLASTTIGFIGFSLTNATTGSLVNIQTNGIVSGFIGLTPGSDYYLQDDGSIGVNVGTLEAYVGTAISSTQIVIEPARSMQYIGSSPLGNGTATTTGSARFAIGNISTGNSTGVGAIFVAKTGAVTSSPQWYATNTGGGSVATYGVSCNWSGNTVSCSNNGTGSSGIPTGTLYFYR